MEKLFNKYEYSDNYPETKAFAGWNPIPQSGKMKYNSQSKGRDAPMGVKYNREYRDIVRDLGHALGQIEDCYETFEMERGDWEALNREEQLEFMRTLADDIFYGLGAEPSIPVGAGKVQYDPANHIIKVWTEPQVVHLIKLI